MEARIIFKPQTLKQTGTVGQILMWVQDNPKAVRSTNVARLSDILGPVLHKSHYTVKVTLDKMINKQMLLRSGGRRHARFYINYYQKDIPGYILERAPADIQEKVKQMYANLKSDQYVDNDGCVVTPAPKKDKEVAPKVVEKKDETVNVPVTVEKTINGMTISINLNLNLNLNGGQNV